MTDRRPDPLDASVRHLVNDRLRTEASATAALVFGVALLVLSALPWLVEDRDDPVTAWGLPGPVGYVVLALLLVAGVGSVAIGMARPFTARPHRIVAAVAFLTVAAGLWVAFAAGQVRDVATTPGLWLGLAAAFAIGAEQVRQARRA